MLEEISLRNFRLFKDITINFGTITVLIGKQGTGKSTALYALRWLQQMAGKEIAIPNGFTFEQIVHKKASREIISFGLRLRFQDGWPPFETGKDYTATYDLSFDNRGFREQSCVYDFSQNRLEFRTPRTGRWSVPAPISTPGRPQITFSGGTWVFLPFVFNLDPRGDAAWHREMMQWRLKMLDYFVSNCFFFPDDRSIVVSKYNDLGGPGVKMDSSLNAEAVINSLAHREDLRYQWSTWLDHVVGREVVLRRVSGEILVETGGLPLPIGSEGAGVRQIMFPLGVLALAESGSLVAIDEPEVHLHPSAQQRLCEVLVESATMEDKQLVITTQSEHMLLGILNSVTSGELSPGALRVYYFAEKDYVGTIEELQVTEDGSLEKGLTGFTETSLEEMGAYLEARKKRQ